MLDEDVDVFSDEEVEWAMANRFRADRDLVVVPGQMAFPMDVTAGADRLTAKAGFDLTGAARARRRRGAGGARAADRAARRAIQTVEQALGARPMHFTELMAALGSKDGREIVLALDALREKGLLARGENGEWSSEDGEGREMAAVKDPEAGLEFYELSHPWGMYTPIFPGYEEIKLERLTYHAKHGVMTHKITTIFHTSTHVNAPIHLLPGKEAVGDLALDRFFGTGVVVSIPKGKWELIEAGGPRKGEAGNPCRTTSCSSTPAGTGAIPTARSISAMRPGL